MAKGERVDVAAIGRKFEAGASPRKIATEMRVSIVTVYRRLDELGLRIKDRRGHVQHNVVHVHPRVSRVVKPSDALPPSNAMIRLAEFDPVVRRALHARTKMGESVAPSPSCASRQDGTG
jgi:hypothetical protein